MEEILELKEKLYQGDLQAAIAICDELETMGRQDISCLIKWSYLLDRSKH